MPRIPGYNNLPSVAPGQMPDVRLSAAGASEAALGGGPDAAQAFGQTRGLAQDAGKMLEDVQAQDDLADVMKATAKLNDYATDVQFNPETGFLAKKGEQVRGIQPQIQEDWQKTVTDISGSLTSDRQREMFQRQVNERWAHVNGVLAEHTLRERQNYIGEQTDANIKSEVNAGAKAATIGDIARTHQAAQNVEDSVRVWAMKNGKAQAVQDVAIANGVSSVYSESVQSLLANGQDLAAKKVFDENADRMTENDKQRLAPKLLEGSTVGEAQRITTGLFSRARDFSQEKETGPVYATEKDLQDSIDAATKDANPLVKQKVESMAIRQYNIEKTAQKETQDATFQGLADQLRKGTDLETLQNSPAYTTLDENDRRQLEVTASRLAKGDTPYAKVSDPRVVTKFDAMSREDLAQLSEADILRRAPSVTEAQYEKMSTAWKAARNKEDLAEYKVTAEDTKAIFMAIRNSPAVDGMEKIKSQEDLLKPLHKDTNAAYQDFKKEIADKLEVAAREKPLKRLTQKERDTIINDAVIEKTLEKPQGLLHKYGPYAGVLTGAPVLGAIVGYGYSRYRDNGSVKVTDQERTDIRDAVVRITGVEPSEAKIAQMKTAMSKGASRGLLERLAAQ